MDTIGEMKITKDNEVYKSYRELKEKEQKMDNAENSKEKIYWRKEYQKQRRKFFEQAKRSEFKKEDIWVFLQKLDELYFSEKKIRRVV